MKDELKTKQTTEEFVVVSTKISRPCAAQLQCLAKSRGMSVYDLIQMSCDTLVRYMSSEHNLTAEMEKAMAIFEHMQGWSNAFNLADPTGTKQICEATYYLNDPTGKRHGCRAVHVTMPYFDDWQQSENIQTILEQTLNLLCFERYKRLRMLAQDMQCGSILELLDTLIDTHSKDSDLRELRESFEAANFSDAGRPIEYGNKPVRKMHYTPDTKQPTFNFNDEQES